MQNFLLTPPSEAEITALLAATAGRRLLPAHDAPDWAAVRAKPGVGVWFGAILARAEIEAADPMPVLTDELYADFFRTGARLPFENVYFERRRRLGRAALAILLGPSGARLPLVASLVAKLTDTLDEPSWSLPAHVWTEPTGKNPFLIDLKVAETANLCAELVTIFGALLPAALVARIRARLREQVFENYARGHAGFVWTGLPMNWNAVCHQGVLGAALALEEDHALVARMLTAAARSLPVFLGGFGADGSTSEGPSYWAYGFGWFCELNAQLELRSDGRWSLFEGDDHLARIARFAPLLTLRDGHFVNFSDGLRQGRLDPGVLSYLGARLGDPLIAAEAGAGYAHLDRVGLDPDDHYSEFFRLSRLARRAPAGAVSASGSEPERPDAYFEDYGAVVARGRDARGHRWEFAAKGGHNDEHHNHNDCGSFLLNLDGAPALLEIGAPEYVRGYFGTDERYSFLAARSLGHSVPFVNGCEQSAGREFAADVLAVKVGDDRVEFVVDLTRCYPPAARCRRLHRTFVFEKGAGRLAVSDAYELDGPGVVESILICRDQVARREDGVLVTTPQAALCILPAPGARLIAVESCTYRDRLGMEERVGRLRFAPEGGPAVAGVLGFVVGVA